MSTLLDHRRPLRTAGLASLAVAGMLLAAPAAPAATTSITRTLAPMTGTITLDSANDTVTIVNAGGNLSHGLKTSGSCPTCNSDIDWDTLTPLSDETLPADGVATAVVNGGDGADNITGGDGPDLILGGEGNDTLTGAAGDDRIAGDRGNDMIGRDGRRHAGVEQRRQRRRHRRR